MTNIFQNFKTGMSGIGGQIKEGLRSIPIYFESNVSRPISNTLGQQVAKIAGINNANPQRGLRNTISDIDNMLKFNYSNSPSQNQGMISPKGWTPPQGATTNYIPVKNQSQAQTVTKISQPTPTSVQVQKITEIPGFTRTGSGVDYYNTIVTSAKSNKINPALLAGLLFQESGITPTAKNSSIIKDKQGISHNTLDRGIAQINNYYHPEVTDEQAFDPNFAIPWAAKQLADNIAYFGGDINKAIASYNVGRSGASIKGPEVFGGGPHAQQYLNRFSQNLSDELLKELGIKTGTIISSPETYMNQDELNQYYSKKKGK